MRRRVYVYRHESPREGKKPWSYTLTYLTYQTSGACVHDVEATSGSEAKKLAGHEHKALCGNRVTP